jgi:Protein of unknown function (DUF3309)
MEAEPWSRGRSLSEQALACQVHSSAASDQVPILEDAMYWGGGIIGLILLILLILLLTGNL